MYYLFLKLFLLKFSKWIVMEGANNQPNRYVFLERHPPHTLIFPYIGKSFHKTVKDGFHIENCKFLSTFLLCLFI